MVVKFAIGDILHFSLSLSLSLSVRVGGWGGMWWGGGREKGQGEEFIDNQQVTESRQAQRPVG